MTKIDRSATRKVPPSVAEVKAHFERRRKTAAKKTVRVNAARKTAVTRKANAESKKAIEAAKKTPAKVGPPRLVKAKKATPVAPAPVAKIVKLGGLDEIIARFTGKARKVAVKATNEVAEIATAGHFKVDLSKASSPTMAAKEYPDGWFGVEELDSRQHPAFWSEGQRYIRFNAHYMGENMEGKPARKTRDDRGMWIPDWLLLPVVEVHVATA